MRNEICEVTWLAVGIKKKSVSDIRKGIGCPSTMSVVYLFSHSCGINKKNQEKEQTCVSGSIYLQIDEYELTVARSTISQLVIIGN